MAPFERPMVVSHRPSIVTVALSVTILLQFAIECLRRSNQHGVGHFGPKFPGVPLGLDPRCLGLQRANAPRISIAIREIIFVDWIGLSSVLRPRQHSMGYMGDGFYRSKDPTNRNKSNEGKSYKGNKYRKNQTT